MLKTHTHYHMNLHKFIFKLIVIIIMMFSYLEFIERVPALLHSSIGN